MASRTQTVKRRTFLGVGTGVAVAAFLGFSGRSFATLEEVEEAMATFTDGGDIGDGGVTLHLPIIAENGHSVPLSVSVDSPMTDDDHVESVMVFATDNPNPEVVKFTFSRASAVASVSTRMRLAVTQDVIAIAKMSDGSFRRDRKHVNVTIGGCGA